MKLVLMNRPVNFKQVPDHWAEYRHATKLHFEDNEGRIELDEITWRDCKDKVAKKLISDLFPGGKNCDLQVEIKESMGAPGMREYMLTVTSSEGNIDILENLRERFHDNVTISVKIAKYELGKGKFDINDDDKDDESKDRDSTEEMTIEKYDQEPCTCFGSIALNISRFHKEVVEWERRMMKKDDENDEDEDDDDCDNYSSEDDIDPGVDVRIKITANISVSDDEIMVGAQVPLGKMILEKGLCSDLIILAMDGVKIPAHKNFLLASSPVLRKQFGTNWNKKGKANELDFSEISEAGVRAFLRYVYYYDLDETKKVPKIAYELLCVAQKYDVFSLKTRIIACLLDMKNKDIKGKLAFEIYAFVKKMNIFEASKLMKKMACILMKNGGKLEKLQGFKQLMKENSGLAMELRNEITKLVAEDQKSSGAEDSSDETDSSDSSDEETSNFGRKRKLSE